MRRVALAALASLLLIGGFLTAPVSADSAPKRIMSGWIPWWFSHPTDQVGIASAIANADLFTDISPFWFSAQAQNGGGIRITINSGSRNTPTSIANYTSQLRSAGLVVIPSITDGSPKGRMAATLANPTLRNAHVQDIVNLVTSNGYDGIDLNYENFAFKDGRESWAATQPNWTVFVQELGAALRAQGKQLVVTAPGPCNAFGAMTCGPNSGYWVYNVTGIAPSVDRIRIMAYDYSVTNPGPIAPYEWVRTIVQYMASAMPPEKVQIGVPTYGRVWTKKDRQGNFQLTGTCPSSTGTPDERKVYQELTARQSPRDSAIPGILAQNGVQPNQVRWDERFRESTVDYTRTITWRDAAGAEQTCSAQRTMWWVGPEAVLARTQLVGEFGINAAATWTVGGEDPAQWPLLRAYAQSLAPATPQAVTTAPASAEFRSRIPISAVVAVGGTPVANAPATLQFQSTGSTDWTAIAQATTGADGAVTFNPVARQTGSWRIVVPADGSRAETVSEVVRVEVASLVRLRSVPKTAQRGQRMSITVRVLPANQGQRVRVEIQSNGTWQRVKGVARTNAKGRAVVRVTAPAKAGRQTYRVVALPANGVTRGESQVFRVRIR